MGEVELYTAEHRLVIRSVLYIYGEAADQSLAIQMADEIALYWNEPHTNIRIRNIGICSLWNWTGWSWSFP